MSGRSDAGSDYGFGPAVRLRVGGSRRAVEHFAREFAPSPTPALAPQVEVDVRIGWPRGDSAGVASGGHKSARWRVALSRPDARPLHATILLSGGPPSFALSLVQGYLVEPLVAVALAREGHVALPSAGFELDGGALLLMGPARSGKSSVAVRALALGRSLLGDDQVLVDGEGGCRPYPRRLRIYPDIRDTAPDAWRRLRGSTRRTLTVRRVLSGLTRGFVAPSLAVPMTEIGGAPPPGPLRLRRLLVVERSAAAGQPELRRRDPAWAVERAQAILAAQRGRLAALAGADWEGALAAVSEREVEILRSALGAASIEHLRLPAGWEAARAVDALAAQAGL